MKREMTNQKINQKAVNKKLMSFIMPLLREGAIAISKTPTRLKRELTAAEERLHTDERAGKAILGLQKYGVENKWIDSLISNIPGILLEWEDIKKESPKEIGKRQNRISKAMRDLADELDQHEDTRRLNIVDPRCLWYTYNLIPETREKIRRELFNPSRITGFASRDGKYVQEHPVPSLVECLRGCAAVLSSSAGSDVHPLEEELFRARPYKGKNSFLGLKVYAVKRVSEILQNNIPVKPKNQKSKAVIKPSPNQETATIVTILLNLKKPITPNEVSQILKKTRRKYEIDRDDHIPEE